MSGNPLQLSEQVLAQIKSHIASSKYLAVNTVKGPYDLMLLSEVRRLLPGGLFVHPTTPLAIFPLGIQEVELDLCCTYVGGTEIHQGSGPWPKGKAGELLPFIAQIDLRGAYGYRGTQVAIQVFGFEGQEFAFRWVNRLGDVERGPSVNEARLYGSPPLQVPSYPGAMAFYEMDEDTQLSCEERFGEQQLLDVPFFLTPLGVCIGPTPYLPAHAARDEMFDGLTILACVPTVYPQAGVPFDLMGHSIPLDEVEAERLQMVIGPYLDVDSFGILYICQSIENSDVQLRYVSA